MSDDDNSSWNSSSAEPNKKSAPNLAQLSRRDIVLGRGPFVRDHVGNVWYRKIVQSRKADYDKLPRGSQQTRVIATEIVHALYSEGGRFLECSEPPGPGEIDKEVSSSEDWVQVDEETAIVKTLQMFRDLSKERSKFHQRQSQQPQKRQQPRRKQRKPAGYDDTSEESREAEDAQGMPNTPQQNALHQPVRPFSMQLERPPRLWILPSPVVRQDQSAEPSKIDLTDRHHETTHPIALLLPVAPTQATCRLEISHHAQNGIAAVNNRPTSRNNLPVSQVEIDILKGVGGIGLPVWSHGHVEELFLTGPKPSHNPRLDWRDLSLLCKSASNPMTADNDDESFRGSKQPRPFATRTIMLLEKVLIVANEDDNGLFHPSHKSFAIVSWFSDELARWAHTVDMVDDFRPGSRPVAYSACDTVGAKNQSSTDDRIAIARVLHPCMCRKVIVSAAYLTRLRSIWEHPQTGIAVLVRHLNMAHLKNCRNSLTISSLDAIVASDLGTLSNFMTLGYHARACYSEQRFEWLVEQLHLLVG